MARLQCTSAEAGLKNQGPAIDNGGILETSGRINGVSEIGAGLRMGGVEPKNLFEYLDRLVELSRREKRIAEIVAGRGVARIQ